MNTFAEWLKSGPLSTEVLTSRERLLVHIGFLEGKIAATTENLAALSRVAGSEPTTTTATQ